jgi:hypothetical protein
MKLNNMLIPLAGLTLISLANPSNAFAGTRQFTRNFSVNAVGFLDPRPVVVSVPTMGVVELLGCFGAPAYSMRTRLLSFDDAQPFFGTGTVIGSDVPQGVNPSGVVTDQTAGVFQSGGGSPLIAHLNVVSDRDTAATTGTAGHWEWSLWRKDGDNKRGAHVSIDGWNNPTTGKCHFSATVLQND